MRTMNLGILPSGHVASCIYENKSNFSETISDTLHFVTDISASHSQKRPFKRSKQERRPFKIQKIKVVNLAGLIQIQDTHFFISNSIFDPLSLRFSKIVAPWLVTAEPQIVNS